MVNIANPPVIRQLVWAAFRQTHEVRRRERDHGMLLRLDGKSGPEMAVVRKNYGHGIFGGTTIRCQSAVTLRLPFRECLQVG
jgi:hypothetical protein